jgi:hypothetical protein
MVDLHDHAPRLGVGVLQRLAEVVDRAGRDAGVEKECSTQSFLRAGAEGRLKLGDERGRFAIRSAFVA